MTTSLLSLFFVAALLSALFNRRRSSIAFVFAGFLVLLLSGQGWIAKLLLDDLQTTRPLYNVVWKNKNAIVLMGAGISEWPEIHHYSTTLFGNSRVMQAAKLYYNCKQDESICKIVAAGGDLDSSGVTEAEILKRDLVNLGVTESDILLENKSKNTLQNARYSETILTSNGFDLVIVSTSGFHLRRALQHFNHFGVEALGAPSDRLTPKFSLIPVSKNIFYTDIGIHELLGTAKLHIYNFMGWHN